MDESRYTYESVLAHIWIRHGTHMDTSWHTYELQRLPGTVQSSLSAHAIVLFLNV